MVVVYDRTVFVGLGTRLNAICVSSGCECLGFYAFLAVSVCAVNGSYVCSGCCRIVVSVLYVDLVLWILVVFVCDFLCFSRRLSCMRQVPFIVLD